MGMMQAGTAPEHLLIHAHYQLAAMAQPSGREKKQKIKHGMIFPEETFTWLWHVRDF